MWYPRCPVGLDAAWLENSRITFGTGQAPVARQLWRTATRAARERGVRQPELLPAAGFGDREARAQAGAANAHLRRREWIVPRISRCAGSGRSAIARLDAATLPERKPRSIAHNDW